MSLPPVRKRKDYSDISKDDLVFALFYDQIAPTDALSQASEGRVAGISIADIPEETRAAVHQKTIALLTPTPAATADMARLGITSGGEQEAFDQLLASPRSQASEEYALERGSAAMKDAEGAGGYLLIDAPPFVVDAAHIAVDLAAWKRKAIKAVKAGKGATVRFESAAIPPAEQARIRAALASAQSAGDVVKAFETRTSDLHPGAAEMTDDFDAPMEIKAVAAVDAEDLITDEWGAALDWARKAMEE